MNALVQWNVVTTNSDGTPITDLAGYYVYHGFVTTLYDPPVFVAAPTLQYTFTGLEVGITHYFNVKAADTSGNLSAFGTEVSLRQEWEVYSSDRLVYVNLHRLEHLWQTQMGDNTSGFIAEAVGLNVPVGPPPPDQFPIYPAIGGFMIV